MKKADFELLESLFIVPEVMNMGYSFADLPVKMSFNESNVVVYGVPLDITTSFGKGTARGPEAIRLASARQVETFILDEKVELYDKVKIYDLGDLKIPTWIKVQEEGEEEEESRQRINIARTFSFLDKTIPKITSLLYEANKLPVMIGGEHTLSYYPLKALYTEEPIVIHFDAHRDMKQEYDSMRMCHTTQFFHLMNEGYIPGKNIIQIGIRQTDREENNNAEKNGVITFDAWEVHNRIDKLLVYLKKITANKKIYISFDIDVYDLPYVPCTGTPEPFGLNPFEVLNIIKSIDTSAKLIGLDFVEVALRNDDYREGTLATQTLFRILSQDFI
ncbi:MAG: arginase family protein [Nitrososphaeraceae archaeon]